MDDYSVIMIVNPLRLHIVPYGCYKHIFVTCSVEILKTVYADNNSINKQ